MPEHEGKTPEEYGISADELERQFKEAMAPVESGHLIMTGLDLNTGEASTDVFLVTDAATPSPTKTVLLVRDPATGEEFKITVEELKNNGK